MVNPSLHIDQVLSGIQLMDAPAPMVTEFVHGLVDFIPRNIIGGDQFSWKYHAREEKELHEHLVKETKGKGFKHDDPVVAKVIYDSFEMYPLLQDLYRGT